MYAVIARAFTPRATGQPLTSPSVDISSFTARSEEPLLASEVGPGFGYHVHIEGRPLDVLTLIMRKVFEMVTLCETGDLPGPFARWP